MRHAGLNAAIVLLSLCACTAGPPPAPAPTMPAPQIAPAPPPPAAPAPAATRNEIVIHTADLYGSIRARYGTTVSIASLLMTSKTPPAPGMKGALFRKVRRGEDVEWLAIADVIVKDPPDAQGTVRVTITDEKKDALLDGRRVNHLVKGVDVRLTWEW